MKKKELRKSLLNLRDSIPDNLKIDSDKKISKSLSKFISNLDGPISFYWPMKNEFDPTHIILNWLLKGKRCAALPVIVKKNSPMKFLNWNSNTVLYKGIFNLPVPPISAPEVKPSIIIIPCVGFDSNNYRLGYGGGYYDRTLVNFKDAKKIGVCYEACRVKNLEKDEHDIPMDFVISS